MDHLRTSLDPFMPKPAKDTPTKRRFNPCDGKHRHAFQKSGMTNDNYLFFKNIGNSRKMPNREAISPPIVPAANGNQNPSCSPPIKNGIKPKTVDTTVNEIGMILWFHAFR